MKTLLFIATRASHLLDIEDIVVKYELIASSVNWILIINEQEQLTETQLKIFKDVYFVPVDHLNEIMLQHQSAAIENALQLISQKYSNLLAVVSDELSLDIVEPILAKYKLPEWTKGTALICRDKVIMKQYMQEHGVRTPKFIDYVDSMEYQGLVDKMGLPFVIKLTNLGGSLGFYKINNLDDYQNFQAIKEPGATYEVEEFIVGDLYHVETVKVGEHFFCTLAEYAFPPAESKNGKLVGSIEITESHPYYQQLNLFNQKVVNSLNNNGIFHLEAFINQDQEIIFLEIAWRQAGSPVDIIFAQRYGLSQTSLYIILGLGYHNIMPSLVRANDHLLKLDLPKKTGIFEGVHLPKLNAKAIEVNNLIPVGTRVDASAFYCGDICAQIILKYDNFIDQYSQMRLDFEKLKKSDLY